MLGAKDALAGWRDELRTLPLTKSVGRSAGVVGVRVVTSYACGVGKALLLSRAKHPFVGGCLAISISMGGCPRLASGVGRSDWKPGPLQAGWRSSRARPEWPGVCQPERSSGEAPRTSHPRKPAGGTRHSSKAHSQTVQPCGDQRALWEGGCVGRTLPTATLRGDSLTCGCDW